MIKYPGFILVLIAGTLSLLMDVAAENHRFDSNGWHISADSENSTLTIEYEHLGVVANHVQFYVKRDQKWQKLLNWNITTEEDGFLVRTDIPSTELKFYIRNRVFGVYTNLTEVRITAVAPADNGRFPARMIDYSGKAKPVAWNGTDEISYSYGGIHTKNLSFLPADNPDVLYLSLGKVFSRNMHCLFDRQSDTMIRFHQSGQMMRRDENGHIQFLFSIEPALGSPGKGLELEIAVIYSDYYTRHLGLPVYKPMDDRYFKNPPVMWNSWTNYYYLITEDDVVKNVDWIEKNLRDYGLEYVIIDDGPDRGDENGHHWISNWSKERFPHGPKWLTDYIKSKGLKTGLWVVPHVYAGALQEHPEWYLRNKDGKHIIVYSTPALDYTNPEVLDFLKEMFTTLKNWGFEYYKFDGEFALTEYIPNIDRSRLFDSSGSPIAAYRNRLEVIRQAVGDETFLEGCPSGAPLQGIGYFNSYFTGDDIYNSWLGMYPFFVSLNANVFLNHISTYIMPCEGICVMPKMDIETARKAYNPEFIRVASTRERNISSVGTTMSEARTIVTFVALCGTPFSFADKLPDLPGERIDLLKKAMPALPIVPMDLFSRGGYASWNLFKEFTPQTYQHNFPRIIDLKVNAAAGIYDVVAATNWTDTLQSRTISFADNLGLVRDSLYLVFDFWSQEFLGEFKNAVELQIEPHDTRVLHIRPALNRPQLLSTDRHLSGAYSVRSLNWDSQTATLSGSSKTIAAVPYSFYLHVPQGFSITAIKSNTWAEIKQVKNSVFKATLGGQQELLNWAVLFAGETK